MTPFQSAINIIIAVCWGIFLLFWLVTAFFTKRTVWRQNPVYSILMALILWIGGFLLLNDKQDLGMLWTYNPVIGVICAIVAIAALGLLIWSRTVLGRNWSNVAALKEDHELVTSGPYSLIRNPIYAGFLLLATATIVNYGRLIGFFGLLIFAIVFIIRTYQEEKLMMKTFPDAYPAYKARTKRLIPWIW